MSEPIFKVGDVVAYKTLDMEYYSRGYGIVMETKASTIISISYTLANGDVIEQSKLLLVPLKEEEKNPTNK